MDEPNLNPFVVTSKNTLGSVTAGERRCVRAGSAALIKAEMKGGGRLVVRGAGGGREDK